MVHDDEHWDKMVGQFRMHLGVILKPLRMYGQQLYVDTATEEVISLAIQLHRKLEGIDEPFHLNHDKLHW